MTEGSVHPVCLNEPMADTPPAPARPRRIIGLAALGALVLVLVAVGWIGVRALIAKSDLEAAVPLAAAVQRQVVSGETDRIADTYADLRGHADRAAALTSDPIWRAAEGIPGVGPNLTAVRELADVVDAVAIDALQPLTRLAGEFDPSSFKPVDNTISLQPLVDAAPTVRSAALALADARSRAGAIDTAGTVDAVADAVERLAGELASAQESVASVDRALALLPPMLGADGPRNYLLLFQNPAELRSGGGSPSALALLHTEGGRIDLVQQASSSDFPRYDPPVLELPFDTRALYGDITGRYIQDVTLTPQFPLAASLAREMWNREFGTLVDGVIAVDPVTLGYLLRVTGPVTLESGEQLGAENAVPLLLSEAYSRFADPAEQDAFFATTAAAAFSHVIGTDSDPIALVSALARAGDEGRILLWSAHPDDQTVLETTTLAGGLPVSTDQNALFGVYLNDSTGAKMDYYLETAVAVGQAVCRNDGLVTAAAEVTLTSTAPSDAGTALPAYVTGDGIYGVPPGNTSTIVSVYGPPGAINLGATSSAEGFRMLTTMDTGYPVTRFQIELAPGETRTAAVSMLLPADFDGQVDVVMTPGVNAPVTQRLASTCGLPLQ